MSNTISNADDVIDSRDVIARIEELEELESGKHLDKSELEELDKLRALASEGESSPDWPYGEQLIAESYFTQYIEELINDCYEMPKEFNSGNWPYRHMTIDYEAAANEAKIDYMEVDFDGVAFLIRAWYIH